MPVIKYKDPQTGDWVALGSGVLGTEIPFSENTPEKDNAWIDPVSESLKYKDPDTGVVKEVGSSSSSEPAEYTEVTMLVSGWVDDRYSFEDIYPHSSYDLAISVSSSATLDQYEEFCNATICGSATSNVVTALSDAPALDVPVIVKAVRK